MATYNLIFYNSTVPSSILLMEEYKYKCNANGWTLTCKDVYNITNSTLGTYIGNLTQIYTEIVIASACEATADSTATDTLNCANQYTLLSKLITASQGTLSSEYTNSDTGYAAHAIGLTTAGFTANALVGTPDSPIYCVITGGTGASQLSTIKSNTTTVITVYGTFYAVPSTDSDFKTLTGCKLFVVGQAQVQSATVTKNRSELGWTAMYPGITLPIINVFYAGVPGYALYTGTCTSGCGAATATDSALGATTNQWANYWVVVYDASAYGYQYGKILSNTSTVLTLTANWGNGTPTGTGKILRIYAREIDCLKDVYFTLWMMTNMTAAATNSTQMGYLTRLIDNNGSLANGTAFKQTFQDLDFLNNTVLVTGKTYLDFVHGGVTVSVPA